MSEIEIPECSMRFVYPTENLFHLGKQDPFASIGQGLKMAEFVVKIGAGPLFIEAKSSFSNPANKADFTDDLRDAAEKLRNAERGGRISTLEIHPHHQGA